MRPVLPKRSPVRRRRHGLPERRLLGLAAGLGGAVRPRGGRVGRGGAAHRGQVRRGGGGAQGEDVSSIELMCNLF